MPTIPYRSLGVTYNGLHEYEHPNDDQIQQDLSLTREHFDRARTYYPQFNGQVDVGKIAKAAGLDLLLGLFLFDNPDWIAGNYEQFVKPAVARGNVEGILIGNEDPQMFDTIVQYLKQAKSDFPQVPVGTSQTADFWLSNPNAGQMLDLVDFLGANIYPAWDWSQADGNNQPIDVTPDSGFTSFTQTYGQLQAKYPGRQVVVTETGWPTTFGPIGSEQFPVGISNARDYLNRVKAWAQAQSVVVYYHNMFDDHYGVDASSPFNYHFGLFEDAGKSKGILS